MKLLSCILLTLIISDVSGQKSWRNWKKAMKKYGSTPMNIDACMERLDKLFDTTTKNDCASLKDSIDAIAFNNKYSKEIQDIWYLQTTASSTTRYFYFHNVTNPIDMTLIIINSYHRKLNNIPIDFYQQLREYYAQNKMANTLMPVERFQIGDTLRASYGNYELAALVEEKDIETNKLKIHVIKIIQYSHQKEKEVNSHSFGSKNYAIGTIVWEDATWWRKKGEVLAIDTY